MNRLPVEIMRYIFELATTGDHETACQLCLVSQAWRLIAQALLFRHVCLSSTEQIKSFNAALSSSSSLNNLVHGMTLSDEGLAFMEPDNVLYYIRYEVGGPQKWIKPWAALIRSLGVLSRQHSLQTLIISAEACTRLAFGGADRQPGKKYKVLRDTLKQSKLRLNHLVISHASIEFFLTRVKTKKITWYGCNFAVVENALDFCTSSSPLRSDQLDAIDFMISDNTKQMHPTIEDDDHNGESEEEAELYKDFDPRDWPVDLATSISKLCTAQVKPAKVSVSLHRKTQEAKGLLTEKLAEIKVPVSIGEWGRIDDSSHAIAELESFASRGWIHRKAPSASAAAWEDVTEDEDDVEDKENSIDANQDKVEDGSINETGSAHKWIVRRPPGKQFCGCMDMGQDPDVPSDNEDDYWQEDMGAWSDDSDKWDPMQRLAFLSGESYHYSQAYLDEYAL